MTVTDTMHPAVYTRAIIRAILCANFFLLALFVIPTHHWVDRGLSALRAVNLEGTVGGSIQVWIPASTLIVTGLFGLIFWKNRRAALPFSLIRSEGILLLAWWISYGFMLGMGG